MIGIAAGSFVIGTPSGDPLAQAGEGPAHRVTLSAYCLDVHEVTEAELATTLPAHARTGCGACPATAVSWDQAASHCTALGKRLPTEAEFEYAARGARPAAGSRYPWGETWPPPRPSLNARDRRLATIEPSWVPPEEQGYDDGFAGIAPACALGRDPAGFCDLLGNAAEWCDDGYSPASYALGRSRDPRGPLEGPARVVRGGSFLDGPRGLRPAARAPLDSRTRSSLVGFRCAAGAGGARR